jgi:hypothetical protein
VSWLQTNEPQAWYAIVTAEGQTSFFNAMNSLQSLAESGNNSAFGNVIFNQALDLTGITQLANGGGWGGWGVLDSAGTDFSSYLTGGAPPPSHPPL